MASRKRRGPGKGKGRDRDKGTKDGEGGRKGGEPPDTPAAYRKRKVYGAGAKQVAWEEFDQPRRLRRVSIGRRLVYVLADGETEPVTLTITHNDGTSQTWRIVGGDPAPGQTNSVHIAYDSENRPTSIYIE